LLRAPFSFTSRRVACVALALLAVGAVVGCDSTNVLGGVWRMSAPPTGDSLIGFGAPKEGTVGVELVLGHYGPDVTGLLRFYRTDDFVLPRQASAPKRECGCTFLRRGRWNTPNKRLDFVLQGCLPGAATRQTVYVRGDFTLNADGTLAGGLEVEDPASAHFGRRQLWTFERFEGVSRSDLICEPETDADAGNTANGL